MKPWVPPLATQVSGEAANALFLGSRFSYVESSRPILSQKKINVG